MIKQGSLEKGTSLLYSGAYKESRNGVGIVLSNSLRGSIVSIKRTSDRIMVAKLCWQGKNGLYLECICPTSRM